MNFLHTPNMLSNNLNQRIVPVAASLLFLSGCMVTGSDYDNLDVQCDGSTTTADLREDTGSISFLANEPRDGDTLAISASENMSGDIIVRAVAAGSDSDNPITIVGTDTLQPGDQGNNIVLIANGPSTWQVETTDFNQIGVTGNC